MEIIDRIYWLSCRVQLERVVL